MKSAISEDRATDERPPPLATGSPRKALDGASAHHTEGKPLVSVVIPTYNRVDLLPACLDSVLAQDYPSFEVAVVDDGSTDETPELCRRYGDKIRYLRKVNGGTASALNVGVGAMRGSWFKWLSSDDMIEKGGLSALVAAGEGSDADIVYGDLTEIDHEGRFRGERRQRSFTDHNELLVELWRHFIGSACGSIIRASAFDRVGLFDESLGYAEDYEWWLRAALIQGVRFKHIPTPVGMYRVHPGQISQERKEAALRKQVLIRKRVVARLAEASAKDPGLAEYYAEMTRRLRRMYGPLVPLVRLSGSIPKSATVSYFLSRIFPKISSQIYWAGWPPLGP